MRRPRDGSRISERFLDTWITECYQNLAVIVLYYHQFCMTNLLQIQLQFWDWSQFLVKVCLLTFQNNSSLQLEKSWNEVVIIEDVSFLDGNLQIKLLTAPHVKHLMKTHQVRGSILWFPRFRLQQHANLVWTRTWVPNARIVTIKRTVMVVSFFHTWKLLIGWNISILCMLKECIGWTKNSKKTFA